MSYGYSMSRLRSIVAAAEREASDEFAALVKDAERYRWMREHGAWESEIEMDELSKDPQKFDAAVDEAMRYSP